MANTIIQDGGTYFIRHSNNGVEEIDVTKLIDVLVDKGVIILGDLL